MLGCPKCTTKRWRHARYATSAKPTAIRAPTAFHTPSSNNRPPLELPQTLVGMRCLSLTFRDLQREAEFRASLVIKSRPTELQLRILGCCTWAFQALRASDWCEGGRLLRWWPAWERYEGMVQRLAAANRPGGLHV